MADENVRIMADSTAGITMGTVIFHIIRFFEVFSTTAASSRLASIFRRIPPIRI